MAINHFFAKPTAGARPQKGHRLARGLVAAWLFNEGDNSKTVHDAVDIHHGTLGNASLTDPTWVGGGWGKTLKFTDGGTSGNFVSVTDPNGNLNFNRSFSLAALVCPTGVAGTDGIISHGQSGWYFRLNTGKIDFLESGVADVLNGTTAVTANVWNHVCMTMDASGNLVFYLNGVQDATGSTARTYNDSVVGVTIGSDQQSGGGRVDFFDGLIDGVMAWNRPLTANEAAELASEPFRMFRRRELPVPLRSPGVPNTATVFLMKA